MKLVLTIVSFLIAFPSAHAQPSKENNRIRERCNDDQIDDAASATGRNAWAKRCGHIDHEDEAILNRKGKYAVFNYNAPRAAWAPCDPELAYIADCLIGCFQAEQALRFSGTYTPIGVAGEQNTPTVTALAEGSTLASLRFSETAIAQFVRGHNEQDLVRLRAVTGEEVVVTSNHPMIDDRGSIVRADHVQLGDALMGEKGNLLIENIEAVAHKGDVWNVSPESTDVFDNINVAQGFLTGSVRFQNEWAYDEFRLMLRRRLDASKL